MTRPSSDAAGVPQLSVERVRKHLVRTTLIVQFNPNAQALSSTLSLITPGRSQVPSRSGPNGLRGRLLVEAVGTTPPTESSLSGCLSPGSMPFGGMVPLLLVRVEVARFPALRLHVHIETVTSTREPNDLRVEYLLAFAFRLPVGNCHSSADFAHVALGHEEHRTPPKSL